SVRPPCWPSSCGPCAPDGCQCGTPGHSGARLPRSEGASSSAAVTTARATASRLLPAWSASRGREGRVSGQLSQRWPAVFTHIRYEHPNEAIAWLSKVFGFREQVRLTGPDGTALAFELEGPGGGMLMVGGVSQMYKAILQRVV